MAAGMEILFTSVRTQITSQQDALVSCLHWNMISNGYKCIGTGDEPSSKITGKPSEVLPEGWNNNQDVYGLLYQPSGSMDTHVLKVVRMDKMLLVHLLRFSDEAVSSMSVKIDDYSTADLSSFDSALTNLSQLQQVFQKEILQPLQGERTSGSSSSGHDRRGQVRDDRDDPLRIPPRHGQRQPPDWGERTDPFAIGRGDLDPLAGGRGGGMLMDPSRAGFPHGGFPHPGAPDPSAGLPGRLPLGAVPPGARFDPFGPPDIGPPGQPRGGHRAGPDPDHLPPPGYDDMFM